jgi:hypothetical protein
VLPLVVTSLPLLLSMSSPADGNTTDRLYLVRHRRHKALPLKPRLPLLLLLRDADAVDRS